MPRFLVYVSVAFGWIVGLSFLAFWLWLAKADAAQVDRDRARDDREDRAEKARAAQAADIATSHTPKRGPLPWELHVSMLRTTMLWTNIDATETRYACGVATVTHKKSGASIKSAEVCSGALPPHTSAVVDIPLDAKAIAHVCSDVGEGSLDDVCAIDFVKSEH